MTYNSMAEATSQVPSQETVPYYVPSQNEVEIFEAACASGLALMLKGPTGCGKTRLVEYMASRLHLDLYTVSCHEDITATDLLGRYLLKGSETVWVDGPLTAAVRNGGICYLDEVVEARQDAIVAIHSIADHRRELFIERLGVSIKAHKDFALVISYNPGYQSVLKDLKMSTRQRMVSIQLDHAHQRQRRRSLFTKRGLIASGRKILYLSVWLSNVVSLLQASKRVRRHVH
jgi:nitric oxide reductase NorQ protein